MSQNDGNLQRLYVRTDATAATGLGHFMRCLAIAQAWRDAGGAVTFIGCLPSALAAELDAEGIARVELEHAHPSPFDLQTTLAHVPAGAPVVLDGYGFDVAFQESLAAGRRLLVIDDIAHQPAYAGFALLNPNVGAASVAYPRAPQLRLLGVRYAPLRRAFRTRAESIRRKRASAAERCDEPARPSAVNEVLLSLGGADVENYTLRVLRTLTALVPSPAAIRTVIGPLNPNTAALEAFAQEHAAVELLRSPHDMPERLGAADLAIASAGSISAELAALGTPAILFAVADNQLPVGLAMQRAGTARFGGDLRRIGDDELGAVMASTLRDEHGLAAMRAKGPAMVDARGALRVCEILNGDEQ
jgi:UDP-2,4-diacetamido-2,4,6-trideoxy-beta-L-altropyranose hydrolase